MKEIPLGAKIATAIGGIALAGGIAIGVSRGQEQPRVEPTTTPSAAAASPTPERTPIVTPTVAPTAEPTPTPEAAKVPCEVLPIEVCDKGELIHWKNSAGNIVTFIGFKLEPGTQIFAPIDGQLAKSRLAPTSAFKGFYGNMVDAQGITYNLRGDIQFSNMNTEKIQSQTQIGMMSNTGTTNLDGYNLIINIDRYDSAQQKFVAAEDILKKLFPTAFTKPAIEKSSTGSTGTTIVVQTTSRP